MMGPWKSRQKHEGRDRACLAVIRPSNVLLYDKSQSYLVGEITKRGWMKVEFLQEDLSFGEFRESLSSVCCMSSSFSSKLPLCQRSIFQDGIFCPFNDQFLILGKVKDEYSLAFAIRALVRGETLTAEWSEDPEAGRGVCDIFEEW